MDQSRVSNFNRLAFVACCFVIARLLRILIWNPEVSTVRYIVEITFVFIWQVLRVIPRCKDYVYIIPTLTVVAVCISLIISLRLGSPDLTKENEQE